jgi:hypothetical protein
MKAYLQLYIEGNRVDLFNDESVSIVQSIQNVKDISQIFVEFTRTFNIPASKKNNKIFEHYYNYSISDGFDARLKKNSTIELNSRPFKTGKIKLDGVDLQDGQPNTYRITFFGNTIDLNDLLGDDNLSSLDLTAFDTTYNASTVETALKTGITKTYSHPDRTTDITYPKGIIAPLISHTTRLYYQSADTTDYPDANGGNLFPFGTDGVDASHQGVYWEELKYAIKIDAIIRAVEDKYGLTFSTDFFNTTNTSYYNLYMWMHRKKGKVFEDTAVSKQVTGFTIDRFQELPVIRSESDRLIVQNATGSIQYSLTINATTNITGTVRIYKDGIEDNSRSITNNTSVTLTGYLENATYTVFVDSSASSFVLDTDTQWDINVIYLQNSTAEYPLTSNYTFNNTREFIISQQIPEMKVIDFLTGLFRMFNLTAYTDNGTIIIKTLDEYYSDSDTVWDITNYVDTTESSVNVALPYKEIVLEYEGLGTKLVKQHEQLSSVSWGTEGYSGDDYYDANPETYEVTLPFEHMKFEKLNGTGTDPQIGWFVDDNNDPYYGSPLLLYAHNQTSATEIRFLITENAASPDVEGTNYNDITSYYIPSNSQQIDYTINESNIHFRNEINEYSLTNQFEDTLFKVYYENYISQVFQTNKRLTTVNAYLPIKMLQEFILADTIAISDRNYTINQIETDFTTGRSKLELINEVTVSVGGSTPITTTTTSDEDECTECTADSTFCTVDGTTPTADKTCDVGRSLVISGLTSQQQTEDITLTATANNFIGTASYLWSGGNAAGLTTSSITITNATTGNVTYTCIATDSDDSEEFTDTHTVLWTPKTYVITLNVIDNISSPTAAAYNITGDQTGSTQTLQEGQTYSFNSYVSANSGYQFTSGPSIVNAQGTVGTSNLTVNTTLSGTVQATSEFLTISGPTAKTVNNDITLFATPSGFTPTSYSWSGGSASGSTQSITFTETSAGTYTYTCTATDGTITATDTYEVVWTTQTLIDITLAIDTSSISGPTNGYEVTGDQAGLIKSQNSGTVFVFSSDVELNSGYEWVGTKPTVNNAGGTFTTSQTVTTVFGTGEVQLIVYNYYKVTGCPETTVVGETKYIRSRDTFTVGNITTGSYIEIDGQCYYTSATAFETDWATNNGVTVGAPEGVGCETCTQTEPLVDTCLETKSVAYLRYSSSNDVCENHQSKNFYYIDPEGNDPVTQSVFCAATQLWNYVGPTNTGTCTVTQAAAGYYSLDSDNTKRRYWNGTTFSVCTTCVDANVLFYLGEGFNPLQNFCDEGGVQGFYYFDNNKTLLSATSAEHMYTSATNIGTPNKAPQGFYTDLNIYRYYEPSSLQVWESVSGCPVRPEPECVAPTKPTLNIWRRYGDCATGGLDALITFGNSVDSFPDTVEYNGDCYSNPVAITGSQSDPWIDAQSCDAQDNLVRDYTWYGSCLECTGTYYWELTKCEEPNINKIYRSAQDTGALGANFAPNARVQDSSSALYRVTGQVADNVPSAGTVTDTGETGCPSVVPDDNVFVVERQSDTQTTYVQLDAGYQIGNTNITISTDGANCYDITGTDYVANPTSYGTITGSCTTTTTTTTTTTLTCGSQLLYRSITDAENVCCNTTRTVTTYMNSNDISTATAIYTDDTCSTLRTTPSWYTASFGEYYYWSGSSLTGPTTCPSCP